MIEIGTITADRTEEEEEEEEDGELLKTGIRNTEDGHLLPIPGGSDGKESACKAGDLGSIPGLGRCPEEGNGSPFQYSYLESSTKRGIWWATAHGFIKSQT